MSKQSKDPTSEDFVLHALRNVVIPGIPDSTDHIIMAPGDTRKAGSMYTEIFPYRMHKHDYFEWMWVTENNGLLKVEDTIYDLGPGDFYLVPPGVNHADVCTAASQPYKALWCHYRNESIVAHFETYAPPERMRTAALISSPVPALSASILLTLQSELETPEPHTKALCGSLLSALTHIMLRAFESSLAEEADELPGMIIRRVLDYLNRNYHKSITLDDLAHVCHRSRNYLATIFKQETGKTIGETLTHIRVERAKHLLLQDRLPVHEVARSVGYSSPEHFSRMFVRCTQIPPSQYGK